MQVFVWIRFKIYYGYIYSKNTETKQRKEDGVTRCTCISYNHPRDMSDVEEDRGVSAERLYPRLAVGRTW
jgi:hypothetical protein